MKTKEPNVLLSRYLAVLNSKEQRLLLIIAGTTVLLLVGALLFIELAENHSARVVLSGYEAGMVADRDIVLDQDIVVLDVAATRQREQQALSRVPPVFKRYPDASQQNLDQIEAVLSSILNQESTSVLPSQMADAGSQVFTALEMLAFRSLARREELVEKVRQLAGSYLARGIVQVPVYLDLIPDATITIDNAGVNSTAKLSSLLTPQMLPGETEKVLAADSWSASEREAIQLLTTRLLRENIFHDAAATKAAEKAVLSQVPPVYLTMKRGETIVRKGFVINDQDVEKLRVLASRPVRNGELRLPGKLILLFILFLVAALLLGPVFNTMRAGWRYAILCASFDLFFLFMAAALKASGLSVYLPPSLLPSALFAMMLSVLIGSRPAVLNSFVVAFFYFLVWDTGLLSFILVGVSGVIASLVVRNAQRRYDLINAGLLVGIVQGMGALGATLLAGLDAGELVPLAVAAFLNGGLCGVLTIGLLPVFENMLNAPTIFRLMELADLNSPILKKMLNHAPGTYNHSVSVANLAETACREIQANALLARVGAYYHDIGKIDQAEYFTENQSAGNKHDQLQPGLSTTIIKAHVKMGLELATKLRLPEEVKEIITQHHGNGLIQIFYQRAVDQAGEDNVSREDYSYGGAPPSSRESAVVMLADGVEAATRSLQKPNVQHIEKVVDQIIEARIANGQLKDSPLTFRDLETIRRCFVRVLAGYYHSRIEYPKQNNG